MVTTTAADPISTGTAPVKGWNFLSWVPYVGTPVRLEEAPIPEKKSLWGRFTEFSEMQNKFIEEQPLVAAIYMLAAIIFGLPNLLSLNPFSFIYATLTIYFGFALAWNAWRNEGIMRFASRVIAEVKAYTSGTEDKKGDSKTAS